MTIVALFGNDSDLIDRYINYICKNHMNCHKITRVSANLENSTDFAQKIYNGQIIEATAVGNKIEGTDISDFKDEDIYLGNYNFNSIECLLSSPNKKIIPICLKVEDLLFLKKCLEETETVKEGCQLFIKKSEEIDYSLNFDIYEIDDEYPISEFEEYLWTKIDN